jgi:Ice-binding-like
VAVQPATSFPAFSLPVRQTLTNLSAGGLRKDQPGADSHDRRLDLPFNFGESKSSLLFLNSKKEGKGKEQMTKRLVGPMAVLIVVCGNGFASSQPVNLGKAGTFAILTKTGITDVPASAVTGDVGTSPITGAALLLTCGEVSGKVYSVDAAGPLPCVITDATLLTAAVGDMGFAYDDAAGRTSPDFTELGAGEIGGLTLAPGLYKWGTGLLISTDVTLSGGPDDVWIFQVAGTLNQANATRVTLAGGALAKNIFWQVAGAVTIGTTAHFEGVLLAKTLIAVNTGASVNGRLLAQTAVTLQMNAVTQPAQ